VIAALITIAALAAMLALAFRRESHWKTLVVQRDTQWQADIAALETKHHAERRRLQSEVRNVDMANRRLIEQNAQMMQSLEGAVVFSDRQVVDNRYFPDSAAPDLRDSILQSALRKSAGRLADKITSKARIETEPDRHTDTTVVRMDVHLRDIWDR
jgi:hypothetical protein